MKTQTLIHQLAHVADFRGHLAAHLAGTSFYTDPASCFRHRCYPGGLADHCLGLYLHLRQLCAAYESTTPGATPYPQSTLATIALSHDLCKVGTYQRTTKSQEKKGEDGRVLTDFRGKPVWEDVDAYEYVVPAFPLGHGDASLFRLLEALPDLRQRPDADSIMLAVRWHMGVWNAAPGEEQNRLADANARSPLVLLTQFADLLDTYHGLPGDRIADIAEAQLIAAGILYPVED